MGKLRDIVAVAAFVLVALTTFAHGQPVAHADTSTTTSSSGAPGGEWPPRH